MEIKDQVALVTGGASGLGAATARRWVERGGRVVIVDLDDDKGGALAGDLGDSARFVRTDITSPAEVEEAVRVAGSLGTLRVAVNCAGIGSSGRILDRGGQPHDLDKFARIVQVNLIGTFNVLRLAAAAISAAPPLTDGERGAIINTASVAAYEGQIGQVAYAASKGGVVGLTLPAARDLARVGIRVLTVAPGVIDTPMLAGVKEEYRQALAAGVPFPARLGTPEDFADLVEFMVNHGYLNGEVVRMDGALRMAPR